MTAGTRVRTPDGRTGTVEDHKLDSVWVVPDQASNVNRRELFKVACLKVIG